MKKIYKYYCLAERYIAATAFFTIIVLTIGNTILRSVKHPIIWADDISLLLFGWCAFLAADIAMRSNRLVGMDILTSKLPVKVQKILQIVVYIIISAFLIMFIVYGFQLAKTNWKRFMNTLSISYGWATLSLPVGSIMMSITNFVKLLATIKNFKDDSFTIKMHNPDSELHIKEVEA